MHQMPKQAVPAPEPVRLRLPRHRANRVQPGSLRAGMPQAIHVQPASRNLVVRGCPGRRVQMPRIPGAKQRHQVREMPLVGTGSTVPLVCPRHSRPADRDLRQKVPKAFGGYTNPPRWHHVPAPGSRRCSGWVGLTTAAELAQGYRSWSKGAGALRYWHA